MDRELDKPTPVLISVNLVSWLISGEGWSLRIIQTWEQGDREWRRTEKYDRLGRGALIDLLDVLLADVSVGAEFS